MPAMLNKIYRYYQHLIQYYRKDVEVIRHEHTIPSTQGRLVTIRICDGQNWSDYMYVSGTMLLKLAVVVEWSIRKNLKMFLLQSKMLAKIIPDSGI